MVWVAGPPRHGRALAMASALCVRAWQRSRVVVAWQGRAWVHVCVRVPKVHHVL
jgi:hypothetical protein